jgi:hypothetical protein
MVGTADSEELFIGTALAGNEQPKVAQIEAGILAAARSIEEEGCL